MSTSRLSERITIQAKTAVRTATGGSEEAWSTLATVWCWSWGATGQERQFAAMGGQAQVARHFCIRHLPVLTPGHRAVFRGQSYNISFVNHVPGDGWTYFDGKEMEGQEAN